MDLLYDLFKKITHRDLKEISGLDYDRYKKITERLVNNMKASIESKR